MKSILFLDDDPGEQHVVKALYKMCSKAFHGEVDFQCVKTWEEAREFVDKNAPDVVICDLALPPIDSDHSIAFIRDLSQTWPPVIVLTGNEIREEELRLKCIQAGAVDFMLKKRLNRCPEEACERIYTAHLRRVFQDAHA